MITYIKNNTGKHYIINLNNIDFMYSDGTSIVCQFQDSNKIKYINCHTEQELERILDEIVMQSRDR